MMNNYTFLKVVGRGSYGEVHLVRHRTDRKQYVVKKLDLSTSSRRERRSAEQEAQLLSQLRHPNIVTYRESWEGPDCLLFIVMGFCEGGDLYHRLKQQQGALLPQTQVVEWFVQIAMALQYLHDRHVLHRDLKTQNIFLTKTNIIKVGDLGIAKVLESHSDMAQTLIGTPYYMSPELLCNRPYNHKSDVWALGCCVYEMCTLKHAFNAKDINSLVYRIVEGKLPQMPSQYDTQLADLIRRMLSKKPEERPDVRSVLRQTYIRKHISLFLEATQEKTKRKNSVGGDRGLRKTGLKSPPPRPKQPETLPSTKYQNGSSSTPPPRAPPPQTPPPQTPPPQTPPPQTPPPQTPPPQTPPPETPPPRVPPPQTPPPRVPPPQTPHPQTPPPQTTPPQTPPPRAPPPQSPPPQTPPPQTPPPQTPPIQTRDLSMATISSVSFSIHPSPGPTDVLPQNSSPLLGSKPESPGGTFLRDTEELRGAGLPHHNVEEEEEKEEEVVRGAENNRTELKALRPLPLVQDKLLHKKKRGTDADLRPVVPAATTSESRDPPPPQGCTLSARERRRLRQSGVNPVRRSRPQTETWSRPQTETSSRPQTETWSRPQTETSPRPQTETSSRPQTETWSRPQTETSPRPQTETWSRPQTETSPRPQTETSLRPQTETSPRPQTETSLRPQTETWSRPQTEEDLSCEGPAAEQRSPESSEMQDLVLMMTQTLKMAAGDGDVSCDPQEFRLNRKYRDTLLLHGKRELSITSISQSSLRLRRSMEQLRTDALQGLGVTLLQRALEVMEEEEDEERREVRLRRRMGDKYQTYAVMVRQLKFLEDVVLRV